MGDKGPSCAQTGRQSGAQLVCRESLAWASGITGLPAACTPVPWTGAAGDSQHPPRVVGMAPQPMLGAASGSHG